MRQFVVPQFIDVEDKIFGPITTRQFLILLTSGVVIFSAYKLADFALFITVLIVFGGFSLVLAFVKVNGQTFHYFLLNILQSALRPGLRIWKKDFDRKLLEQLRHSVPHAAEIAPEKKAVRARHIRDLSLVVNTGGYYHPDDWQKV